MKKTAIFLISLLTLVSCFHGKVEIKRNRSVVTTESSSDKNSQSQSTLSHIALNDKDAEVRKLAIQRLN